MGTMKCIELENYIVKMNCIEGLTQQAEEGDYLGNKIIILCVEADLGIEYFYVSEQKDLYPPIIPNCM